MFLQLKLRLVFCIFQQARTLIKYTTQNIFGVCKASRTCLQATSRSLKEEYRKKRVYQLTMCNPVIEV